MSDFETANHPDPFVVLFKLGSESHMLELLHNGHLYLNTLEHFKKLDDASSRSDRDEATGYYWQMHGGTFEVQQDEDWHPLGTLVGGLRVHDNELQAANVYCLHARRRSHCEEPWSLETLDFGDTFVLFTNPAEFLRRLRDAAARAGHEARYGAIEYVDRLTYHGHMGAFRKFREHAHQSEFRVLLRPGIGRPLSLHLGSLTDIAVLGPSSKRLKHRPPS